MKRLGNLLSGFVSGLLSFFISSISDFFKNRRIQKELEEGRKAKQKVDVLESEKEAREEFENIKKNQELSDEEWLKRKE